MGELYFYCDHCGIELFDEDAKLPAGWTDGAGREIVTCPSCKHDGGRIDRGRDGDGGRDGSC